MRNHGLLLSTATLSLCAMFSAQAVAQDTTADEGGGLRDIVVTARKASESLQTTPVAVTALDSQALTEQQISEVMDLQRATPGLSIAGAGTGPSSIVYMAIRGNAQNSPNSASDAAVGIYVDGVYYGRPIIGNLGLLDMANAEILRGTQGTLFGRNTTGGALNLTTTQPGGDFTGYARLGIGNYDMRLAEGAVTVPLVDDQLSFRVAGRYSERDGYGYNPITDRDINKVDFDYATRATLRIAPDELPAVLTISGDFLKARDDGTMTALVAVNPSGFLATLYPGIDPSDYLQTKGRFHESYGEPHTGDPRIDTPMNYNRAKGVYANLEIDLGGVQLRSISAYRDSLSYNSVDLDATPADVIAFTTIYRQKQYSEELQLSGNTGNLDWIVGAFYFKESGTEQSDNFTLINSVAGDLAPTSRSLADFKATSKALFAQANYRFTDRLRATGGFRYTWDERFLNRHGTADFDTPTPVCMVAPVGSPCNDPHTAKFKYPAWTAGLDYELDDGMFVYAKTGGAAMAGGFNTRPTPPGLDSFEPEKVKDVEIGFKGDFLDRRLRTNIAAFYIWRNGAQNIVNEFSNGTLTQYVRNAGDIRSYGLEFEGTALPWEGMEITTAIGYLHSRYADGSFIVDGVSGPVDRSGEDVPQAPKWTVSLGATQTFETSWGSTAFHLDYAYTSSRNYGQDTPDPNNPAQIPADYDIANRFSTLKGYGLFNGRITANLDNGIELSVWGRNLTNTKYNQNLFNSYTGLGFVTQFQGNPRTYGITAGYNF